MPRSNRRLGSTSPPKLEEAPSARLFPRRSCAQTRWSRTPPRSRARVPTRVEEYRRQRSTQTSRLGDRHRGGSSRPRRKKARFTSSSFPTSSCSRPNRLRLRPRSDLVRGEAACRTLPIVRSRLSGSREFWAFRTSAGKPVSSSISSEMSSMIPAETETIYVPNLDPGRRARASHRSRSPADSRGSGPSSAVAIEHVSRVFDLPHAAARVLVEESFATDGVVRMSSQGAHPMAAGFRTNLPVRAPLALVPVAPRFVRRPTRHCSPYVCDWCTDSERRRRRTTLVRVVPRRGDRAQEPESAVPREARAGRERRDDRGRR